MRGRKPKLGTMNAFQLHRPWLALVALGFALLQPGRAAVSDDAGARTPRRSAHAETSAQVIVALRPESATLRRQILSARQPIETVAQVAQARADVLSVRAGVPLVAGRMVGPRGQVVKATGISSAALAARLAADPDVEYAVPDRRVRAAAIPNDPLFLVGPASGQGPAVGQWYLRTPDATIRSAVNAQAAWDIVTGSPSIVVAVLDTGVLADHVDLAGNVLPGFDLVSDVDTANDGDGRDANAADPGDWITDSENSGPFFDCGVANSSWHGTSVAGIIGATANNGLGMAGIAHGVKILPVRVLGKCGGRDSDIVAGIYYAAGVDQPGMPGSPTPARVLNLSLGGDGRCSIAYMDAISAITKPPYLAVMVAAAGNSAGHFVGSPANCPGVIAVAGLRHAGSKVGFSDLGPEVTIAAPGGNCVNITSGSPCLYPILTTSNSGTQQPVPGGSIWTDSFKRSVGTSFATPIVAGTAALLLSVRPELTPAQITAAIRNTARPFPTTGADNGPDDPTPVPLCRAPDGLDQLQCYCSTDLCGAGMLDAAAAVASVAQSQPQAVTPAEAARQLMDFAEQQLPQFFPGHQATQVSGPVQFRFYPLTGTYLGVSVQSDATYPLGNVYVFGGVFGNAIRPVGRVTDYIVPRPPQ